MAILTIHDILKLPPSLVRVEVGDGSEIALRVLSLDDVDALRPRLRLPPVELTLATLSHQALEPPAWSKVLEALPRPTLLRIAREWASHPSNFGATKTEIRRFEDFSRVAEGWLDKTDQEFARITRRFSESFSLRLPVLAWPKAVMEELAKVQSATRHLADVANGFIQLSDSLTRSIRNNLPDPEVMRRAMEEMGEGKAHLDVHGYGFATYRWSIPALRDIGREKPGSRELHRAFLTYTREPVFQDRLLGLFRGSTALGRRTPIVEASLRAHQEREYLLSVPVLYAQVEGVLTDLLVLEGLARRSGIRAVRTTGKGELRGLKPKAREYAKRESVMRRFVTASILEDLSPDRNGVLHGAKTAYREAKRSTRLLFLLEALAKMVVEAEPQAAPKN